MTSLKLKPAERRVVAGLIGGQDPQRAFGYPPTSQLDEDALRLVRAKIDVALVAQGFVQPNGAVSREEAVTHDVLRRYREQARQLQATVTQPVPIVGRVQRFLDEHLRDVSPSDIAPQLPRHVFVLAEHGLARELSFPPGAKSFISETLSSYRILQGVLHNPRSDKRTTANSFHVAEGGLPISADKLRVPKAVFATMLREALAPPEAASLLPYTANSTTKVHCMAQLMLRPEVAPEVPGIRARQTMETLCLAPGTLVSCLDYLESIFGNAGDPFLPENDAALDSEHWSGHTGCIVLAPHLTKKTKKELGLPRWEDANELQRAQGMCWKSETELYNNGNAFKLCCRNETGVIVTIVADNYYGYCVAKGTPVSLADGLSIPIESFSPSTVASFGQQEKPEWCPYEVSSAPGMTSALSDGNTFMGMRDCVTVNLFDGSQLTLTPDHRVLVQHGEDQHYVEAGKLKPEHKVVCSALGSIPDVQDNTPFTLGPWNDKHHRPQLLAFARILGAVITDGCIHERSCELHVGSHSDVLAVQRDVMTIVGEASKVPYFHKGGDVHSSVWVVPLPTTPFLRMFFDLGLQPGRKTAQPWKIPSIAFSAPKWFKREFCAGAWGGNGGAPTITAKSMAQSVKYHHCLQINPSNCEAAKAAHRQTMQRFSDMLSSFAVENTIFETYLAAVEKNGRVVNKVCQPDGTGNFPEGSSILRYYFQVGVTLSTAGINSFASCIGVRFCEDKCARFEIYRRWQQYRSILEEQRNFLTKAYSDLKREHTKEAYEHAVALTREKFGANLREDALCTLSAVKHRANHANGRAVRRRYDEALSLAEFAEMVQYRGRGGRGNPCTCVYVPVVSVKACGMREVYDVSVPKFENFVAGGFVVHNCKKEVKTQLSYAANLAGLAEEEHSGGTLALPQYSYGLTHDAAAEAQRWPHLSGYSFTEAIKLIGDAADVRPEGYAVDRNFSRIIYVPEDAFFSLERNMVTFNGGKSSLRLLPGTSYVLPSGFKLSVRHHPAAPAWRLIGTEGRGTVIHKPTTVSGGGKSELSKAIDGAMIFGALFVGDPEEDFALVDELLNHDYSTRFRDPSHPRDTRPLLAESRSLGSVIKLLTPSERDYTDEYNKWLRRFPGHVLPIVYYVKRFWKPAWGTDWRSHFSTDLINGTHGHELKFENRRILAGYLRVGTTPAGLWRTFKTRIDFVAASKVQLEDDISSAITVSKSWLPSTAIDPSSVSIRSKDISFKLAHNCEFRLFQRPDDCVRRGTDAQCEYDLAQDGSFIANFEPLRPSAIREVVEDVSGLEQFTPPMREFLARAAAEPEDSYVVCSDRTRIVNGQPTANPRYLQTRPDAVDPEATYLAEMGMRLAQRVPAGQPLCAPVDVTLLGRRISKPAPGLPNLAVYNPLHYQELPELMADLFCCVSGTSPSTTGAGSEGPLTKGPFNALPFPIDLNNAFVSYALTGLGGWSTPTGNIGPQLSFSHDVSFISPEIFSRMKPFERDPKWLEANGYLERVADFEFEGRKVLASRLGLRITDKFVHFLGRVFEVPSGVFERSILHPELQSPAGFADGVDSIVQVQRVIAQRYFDDGTIDMLCPPLRALCHIMAKGSFEGKDLSDPGFRAMFTREAVLSSAWYHERLETQQHRDMALWQRHIESLQRFIASPNSTEPTARLDLVSRLEHAKQMLAKVSSPSYLETLVGTIGADPLFPKCK